MLAGAKLIQDKQNAASQLERSNSQLHIGDGLK